MPGQKGPRKSAPFVRAFLPIPAAPYPVHQSMKEPSTIGEVGRRGAPSGPGWDEASGPRLCDAVNLFPKRVLVKSFVGELVRSFDVRKTLLPPVPQVPETTRTFLAALGVQQSHDSRPPLSPRNVLFRLPLLFPSPHGSSTTNCFEGGESTSIGRCAAMTRCVTE